MAGADRLISASRNRAAELTGTASKAGKQTATRYDGIVHIYFRNKFIIQYLYLSTFFSACFRARRWPLLIASDGRSSTSKRNPY
jgi:hypothetical protein